MGISLRIKLSQLLSSSDMTAKMLYKYRVNCTLLSSSFAILQNPPHIWFVSLKPIQLRFKLKMLFS